MSTKYYLSILLALAVMFFALSPLIVAAPIDETIAWQGLGNIGYPWEAAPWAPMFQPKQHGASV